IRNAKVTFINRDTNAVIASNVPVGLVNPSDPKTGTATYMWNVNIGSANSQDFTIGIIVNNYYARNSSSEDTVVVVSKAIPSNFIAGGGFLVMKSSAGLTPGQPGTNCNFGLNVKYNAGGTNLQGHVNIIVRNGAKVYQIKSSAMSSLAAQPTSQGG